MALPLDVGLAEGNAVVAGRHALGAEGLDGVVEPLALEHDHRVLARQRRGHQSLGVEGGGRVDHLEAGNMRHEGRPVLRVLGAILAADGAAEHHRQLQDAARHGPPLRHLVEDLVASAADEVAVHQLDQGPAALQRVAHGGRHDRGFRDRRVEQPLVGQDVGQAAIDAEGAAPFPALLAIGDEALVVQHVMQDGLEEAVAQGDRAHGREFRAIRSKA